MKTSSSNYSYSVILFLTIFIGNILEITTSQDNQTKKMNCCKDNPQTSPKLLNRIIS